MRAIATAATIMKKILLIDDDAELRQLLATYLGRHGFDTLLLPDTRQLDAFLERYQPQLLILDLMLPGEDGLAACRRLRARGETRPVIMLTARDEPVDRVIGLEMGADDYLGKPFDPRELVARIEAVLRRGTRSPAAAPDSAGGVTHFGEWLFDRAARQLSRNGQPVALTSGEFALLNALDRPPQPADEARTPARTDARRRPASPSTAPSTSRSTACAGWSRPTRPTRATCRRSGESATSSSPTPPATPAA
jgi:two-component system phosphate regulon response regulator OmpR